MSTGLDLLVVDDHPDFAEFVRGVAADLGFTVRVAGGAARMRQLYAERKPDVVVLDVVMPEADGIELTRWLAQAGFRGRLILVTGYNPLFAQAARTIAEVSGAFEVSVLGKPVPLETLRRALVPRVVL